jgi:hypothetical protein
MAVSRRLHISVMILTVAVANNIGHRFVCLLLQLLDCLIA